jgi:PD-(D/E)XK endonuclease
MRHHTKDKGDAGLGYVIGDLLHHGIQVALPISEHLPFDAIAIAEDGCLCRLQVKYRTSAGDRIECEFGSSWADRNGTHHRPFDPKSCDAVAIYCPDPKMCCYVRVTELVGASVALRLVPARNGQAKGVRMAADYVDPSRLFAPVAQWKEQLPSKQMVAGSSPARRAQEHGPVV